MKNKLFIISMFAAAVVFSSCNKDLLDQTNPNSSTISDYFQSESDVLLAVNGIYQSLRSSNCIGENSGLFTEDRAGNTGGIDVQSNSGEPFQFSDFSILPSNSYLKSHWTALYQSVSRANIVLSNIDNVTFASADTKSGYIAEAKFLRALIYFHLVRKWGDVPLVTKQLTSTEVPLYTFRAKDTAVYAQIVADLKDVLASPLPDFQTGANLGRVSKAAANALLGQVYLTRAVTISSSNKNEDLASAKTYLEACYNMRSFNALTDIPYADVFDVSKKTSNPETIFSLVYKQGDINNSSSIAANNQAAGETINSLKVATGLGGSVRHDLVNEYESTDLRKAFSIKYANATNVKDWFITKFRDTTSAAGKLGYGGNDCPVIRYADVILMLAEVNMYLGDNATAISYLDMVRVRAGLPAYAVSVTDADYIAKYPTLKLAILHERRVELAFEQKYWFDVIRFFTTDELIAYYHAKNQLDFGSPKLANFSRKDRYFPIPLDEYKLDPVKMYQNLDY
ncbi:RagB/SusD family nutrient uptake outer membrane protein [Chitinophaga oryziterrae]|uniref:RagB/SusD family nutrient uptake outer membrane protein n=1 Tax=Chitinophaga oryziterrae TaxID=1031224 RepID=A0A6N8JFK5_9BACT|nr:RagB/SusD family nutrient uptake outer membrane protein [Chitinophaga oryziterrae]MVT43109.1 RagB/SusD family nutrient uptake outer membrane protein [Chitinophaga oryziterrae]